MLIKQEYDRTTNRYKASTTWMTPEWNCVTTCGVSEHSYSEAIGNMMVQMSATIGSPVYLISVYDEKGQMVIQNKT